jgi:3-oxoacyl-[acyl-carrier protein] reductase
MNRNNYLVTGGTRGLGLETVRQLVMQDDAVCYVVSRSGNPEFEKLCGEFPGKIRHLAFGLSDTEGVKKNIFGDFLPLHTPLHGFVNNAAIAYDDIVTNLNLGRLEEMYRVNVFTPMMITKYAIRNMIFHGTKGSIVHVSSISVHTGYKGLAMYASTKGALEAFSKNTAREWGERGIRSNCLVAGFMETDMNISLTSEQKDRIYRRTSLRKPTSLESAASTILFLLSGQSTSVTGQNFFVDSGAI